MGRMMIVRVSTWLKYLLALVVLVLFNILVLHHINENNIACPPCRSEDCNHYQNVIQIQRELIAGLRRNASKTKLRNTVKYLDENTSILPTIYVITPTYARWTQKADLTRMCSTLMHVPNVHWIIVEDSEKKTALVTKMLSGKYSCKIEYTTQLNIRTPKEKRLGPKDKRWTKSRGILQRNLALQWLRESAASGTLGNIDGRIDGVVYFGDDDNTYDLQLFNEMRYTKKVSMWPVGICGGLKYEGPICKNGTVIDWYAAWGKKRAFQIDMAGFAINLSYLLSKPKAHIDPTAQRGHIEGTLLKYLVKSLEELEAKADDCKKVYVWHTRTEKPDMKYEDALVKRKKASNPLIEV